MLDLFKATYNSPEHPIYHPEKYLHRHIFLVTLRAIIFYGYPELVMAALFHDLMKPQDGSLVETPDGSYWSNQEHAKQAAEMIMDNDDIRYFISKECNPDIVHDIVRYHMAVKERIGKKSRHVQFIEQFRILDDMVGRHEVPHVKKRFIMADLKGDYRISHVGMSPIQIHFKMDEFTITVNRTPLTYKFVNFDSFFKGKWSYLKGIIPC